MKILAGVERATSGRLLLDGIPVEFKSTRAINLAWIIEKMVGRNVNAPRHRVQTKATADDRPVLEVNNLCLPRAGGGFTLENVSLCFFRVT
jgi:ABC-type sugar transport system ATPase subunit